MGDAADDAFEAYDFFDEIYTVAYQWMDADGRIWDMHDMSTSHLGNCLRLCEQNSMFVKAEEIMTVLKDRVGVSS